MSHFQNSARVAAGYDMTVAFMDAPAHLPSSPRARFLGVVEWAALLAAVAAVAVLHVVNLRRAGPLWRDEVGDMVYAAMPSWGAIWGNLKYDNFPPGLLVLLRGWHGLGWAATDAGYRVAGLLIGLGIVGAFFWSVRLFGVRAPWFSLGLFAANGLVVRVGDSIRPYGLGWLFILLSFGWVWRVARASKVGWREVGTAAGAAVLAVQCLYQDAFLLLAIGAAGMIVAARAGRWRAVGAVAGIGALAAGSLVPYALGPVREAGAWSMISRTGLTWSRLGRMAWAAPGPAGSWLPWVWVGAAGVLVLVGVVRRGGARRGVGGVVDSERAGRGVFARLAAASRKVCLRLFACGYLADSVRRLGFRLRSRIRSTQEDGGEVDAVVAGYGRHGRSWSFGDKCVPKPELGNEGGKEQTKYNFGDKCVPKCNLGTREKAGHEAVETTGSAPQGEALVYAGLAAGIGGVVYLGFLKALGMTTSTWYYLLPLALVAAALDVASGVLLDGSAVGRWARVGFLMLAVGLSWPEAWRAVNVRATNADLVAEQVTRLAGPEDLVVVYPWPCGVSFRYYYRGAAPWSTVPTMADNSIHRFDLMKAAMQSPEGIDPLLARIEATLRGGHRVWTAGWINGAPPAGMRLPRPKPAPDPVLGWNEVGYLTLWAVQMRDLIRAHGERSVRLEVGSSAQEINPSEEMTLYGTEGWKP